MSRTEPPDPSDWQARYEFEARRAAEALSGLGEAELVARIREGRLDPYFAIWRAIGAKGSVSGAALALWVFLRDNPGDARMLHRYHCADALFRILGRDDPASAGELRRRVQWDHEGEDARQEALRALKLLIDA